MPYSPKVTRVPPFAVPCRSGRCCLRCLTLLGISMTQPSRSLTGSACPGVTACAPGAPARLGACPAGTAPAVLLVAIAPAGALAGPQRGGRCLALGPGLRRLSAVDPHLDADPAERGPRLVEAVVDVGTQGMQRHPALAVELRPRHLRAAEPARALHPDALGPALHRALDRLAHRPPERDPAGQLLGGGLRDKLGIDLGVLHLEDVELDLLAGQLLQVGADPVSLGAAAADHDAWARGVDVDPHPVPGALDLHLGDARALHAALQHPPDRHVLGDVFLVQLVGIPRAGEVGGDAEPEPVRVHLLAHYRVLSSCSSDTMTVMWLVRLLIR